MKKIYVYALLCIPLCLILGLGTALSIGAGGQAAQRGPQYFRETDSTSMMEVGKLLEQLGKQMQQKSISIGGESYAVNDKGSLEISVDARGIQVEIGYGPANPNRKPTSMTAYSRMSRSGSPDKLSQLFAGMGKSIANSGSFEIEDHSVKLKGTATATIQLVKTVQGRGNRPPYNFIVNVDFGDKKFPLTDDEKDFLDEIEHGKSIVIAKKEMKNLDKAELAELLNSISQDLKAGKVSVGDQTLEVGENFGFGLSHLSTTDGSSDRIMTMVMFGKMTPREKQTGPRWGGEFFDASMKELAEILQKVFAGIVKDGTFSIDGKDFKAGEIASYEVGITNRGINLELGYTQPVKK